MTSYTVHPATRFVTWLLLLIFVQCLNDMTLAVAFMFLPLFGSKIMLRGVRLIWRARWLLVSLLIIYSWGVAGDPFWNGFFSPTHEGVLEGIYHLGRLLLVLMVVAAFLETMPLPDLIAATRSLLSPLKCIGFDPDRGVVRLLLVLRYAESLPRPRDWRSMIDLPASSLCEMIEVNFQPLHWSDYLIMTIFIAATALFCFT